jgi:hypothetical protein
MYSLLSTTMDSSLILSRKRVLQETKARHCSRKISLSLLFSLYIQLKRASGTLFQCPFTALSLES